MIRRFSTAVLFFFILLSASTAAFPQVQPAAQKQFTPEPEPLADADDYSFTPTRITLGSTTWIQPHFFAAGGISSGLTWDETKDTRSDGYWSKEAYLKNGRIGLRGQIVKNLSFFIQSDDLSVQTSYKNGFNYEFGEKSNMLYTKDAYIKYAPFNAFQIYAGLLTIPLNRGNIVSDATLLGTEQTAMKSIYGSYSNSGRDAGLMFRGFLFKSILEYRLGVFRGLGKETEDGITRNKHNIPRFSGRVQISAADPETGYFNSENYLGKKSIFGISAGIDYQPDVFGKKNKDYIAWSVDVPLEIRMQGMMVLSGQVGFINAIHCPDQEKNIYTSFFGFQSQVGVLLGDSFQPVAKYTYRNTENPGKQYKTISAGCNYFFDGHKTALKANIDIPIGKNFDYSNQLKGTIQAQVYF